jgi:hypothetical protein
MTLLTARDRPASPPHIPLAPGPDAALADGRRHVATRDKLIADIERAANIAAHSRVQGVRVVRRADRSAATP